MDAKGHATYPSLKGRAVFVTGGATGIGAAIVEGFHAQGSAVTFVDIAEADGAALAARLSAAGTPVRFIACDVTDAAALDGAVRASGPLGVLVNNVANDQRHEAASLTPERWRASLAVNLDPVVAASTAAYPGMKAAGGGAIVNLSSLNALWSEPNLAAYVAAKAAILGLTKAFARDWGRDGIRVNAVSPGWVETERQRRLWMSPEAVADWNRTAALGRLVQPDEVARLVLFLASADSGAITGQNHVVDAGWL